MIKYVDLQFCFGALLMMILIAPECRSETELIKIPKGQYELFYRDQDQEPGARITLPAFFVQKHPVSNREFLNFVNQNIKWKRSKVPKIFSSDNYLADWKSDESFSEEIADYPVVNVTWFATTAYCESKGLRLLTVNEWEYASSTDQKTLEQVLDWYSKPNSMHKVTFGKPNKYGLLNMHGLIWEWVSDYSSIIIKADSRGTNDRDRGLFCGAGSLGTANPELYANYMRFAFRSSLKANYATSNLGFRCGKSAE